MRARGEIRCPCGPQHQLYGRGWTRWSSPFSKQLSRNGKLKFDRRIIARAFVAAAVDDGRGYMHGREENIYISHVADAAETLSVS